MNYQNPEKMLKRYAVMEICQNPGVAHHYPIELALADIFNKTGCACGVDFKPTDIKYQIQELVGEEGEYVVIEAKTICSECSMFLKLTKYIHNEELKCIKESWTV